MIVRQIMADDLAQICAHAACEHKEALIREILKVLRGPTLHGHGCSICDAVRNGALLVAKEFGYD